MMPDQPPRSFTIRAQQSTALWPGDGVICVKVSAPRYFPDILYLVDRNDRVSELELYRFGMFGKRRR